MYDMCLMDQEDCCTHDCFIDGWPCPRWRDDDGRTYDEYIEYLYGNENDTE